MAAVVACAITVGVPTGAAVAAPSKSKGKPRAGQLCSPKKKAPTGFKCMKDKKGKYRLVKG